MENRFLILVRKLFKLPVSVRSSVRARNIAHASITSCISIDCPEGGNIASGKNLFQGNLSLDIPFYA